MKCNMLLVLAGDAITWMKDKTSTQKRKIKVNLPFKSTSSTGIDRTWNDKIYNYIYSNTDTPTAKYQNWD